MVKKNKEKNLSLSNKISNRVSYTILFLLVLIFVSFLVYAYVGEGIGNPGSTPNPGHNIQDIGAPSACVHGQYLTLEKYTDDANVDRWRWKCVNAPEGGGESLWTQSGNNVYRLTGNVGIGTSTPGRKLQVMGEVDATRLCIGGECKDAWPVCENNPVADLWIPSGATFNIPKTIRSISFSIGNRGFFGAGGDPDSGLNGLSYDHFLEYNSSIYSSTPLQDIPGQQGGRIGAFAFSIGDYGYVGGGRILPSGSSQTTFFRYDSNGVSNWTQRTEYGNSPIPLVGSVAFSIGDYGYVGFGSAGNEAQSKRFYRYDPSQDLYPEPSFPWQMISSDTGMIRIGAVGVTDGTYGYICGGSTSYPGSSSQLTNTCVKFDPTNPTNPFSSIPSYPGGAFWYGFGFSIRDKIYVGTSNGVLYEYNPATNLWSQKATFPGEGNISTAFSIGKSGYVVTTRDTENSAQLWQYA